MRTSGILLIALAATVGTLQAQEGAVDTAAVIAAGQKASEFFYAGKMDSLWAMLTPGFRADIQNQQALTDRLGLIVGRAGFETKVVQEKLKMRNGKPQYWRAADFSSLPEPLLLRWVIEPDGKVSGMGIGPLSQAPTTDD